MKAKLLFATAAALNMAAQPAIADNSFATVESVYSADGQLVTGTLRATADQEPIDDQFQFEGFVLAQGRQVPWMVSVPVKNDDGDEAVAAFRSGRLPISETFRHSFSAGDIQVTKVFFDVEGEQQSGIMTVTDDPLPIVAWLVIAGASAIIVPLGIYVAQGCEKITTKTTLSKDSVSYETTCENSR